MGLYPARPILFIGVKNPSSWPANAGHPRLSCRGKDVDGRDIKAFTPVFDGLCAATTSEGPEAIMTDFVYRGTRFSRLRRRHHAVLAHDRLGSGLRHELDQ